MNDPIRKALEHAHTEMLKAGCRISELQPIKDALASLSSPPEGRCPHCGGGPKDPACEKAIMETLSKPLPSPLPTAVTGETPECDAVDDEIREARMIVPGFERDGGSLRLFRNKARILERRLRALLARGADNQNGEKGGEDAL